MIEPVTFFRSWHWARSFIRNGFWDCIARLVPSLFILTLKRLHPLSHLGRTCPVAHHSDGERGQRKLPSKPQRMWEARLSIQVYLWGSGSPCGPWAVCGLGSCHPGVRMLETEEASSQGRGSLGASQEGHSMTGRRLEKSLIWTGLF